MPRPKGALDLSEFQQGCIVGQHEGRFSQWKISEKFSIPLSTINRVIVQFTREGKECTSTHPGCRERSIQVGLLLILRNFHGQVNHLI